MMENTLIVLATIISALAVTGQTLILWRQTKIANEQIEMQRQLITLSENEERSKQAQEISTWVHTYEVGKPETHILHGSKDEGSQTDFIINNASHSPIYNVILSHDDFADSRHTMGIYVIPPGRWRLAYNQTLPVDKYSFIEGKIWFTDAAGNKWHRDKMGNLAQSNYSWGKPLINLPLETKNLNIHRENSF